MIDADNVPWFGFSCSGYDDGEMYDGVVTPDYVDDYGNVQNGDYMGSPGSAMYGNRLVSHESLSLRISFESHWTLSVNSIVQGPHFVYHNFYIK